MTYSTDFGRKVLEVKEEENLTIVEVAVWFKIAVASVVRWGKVLEANHKRKRSPQIDMEALKRDVELDLLQKYEIMGK